MLSVCAIFIAAIVKGLTIGLLIGFLENNNFYGQEQDKTRLSDSDYIKYRNGEI